MATTARPTRPTLPGLVDVGCRFATRCTGCPWRVCIDELPPEERIPFAQAFRLLNRYLAEPVESV